MEVQERRPVLSKKASKRASPRGILPRAEEAFFLRSLQEIMMFDKDLEA